MRTYNERTKITFIWVIVIWRAQKGISKLLHCENEHQIRRNLEIGMHIPPRSHVRSESTNSFYKYLTTIYHFLPLQGSHLLPCVLRAHILDVSSHYHVLLEHTYWMYPLATMCALSAHMKRGLKTMKKSIST